MLASDLLRAKDEPTESALFDTLQGRITTGAWLEHPVAYPLTTIAPGIARGKLTGGNLSIICSTLGTPYEIETQGAILLIEDVGERSFQPEPDLASWRDRNH